MSISRRSAAPPAPTPPPTPGCGTGCAPCSPRPPRRRSAATPLGASPSTSRRSEEHTSELQSRGHLVCRLLLEEKKKTAHIARSCYGSVRQVTWIFIQLLHCF